MRSPSATGLPLRMPSCVEQVRIHVHVAHAQMRIGGVDEQIDRLLLARAHDHAVMRRHDFVLVGLAAVGALIHQRAIAWPDVLALMAFAAGALADEIAAMLAEIIAPWVRVVAPARLVEDQRPVR